MAKTWIDILQSIPIAECLEDTSVNFTPSLLGECRVLRENHNFGSSPSKYIVIGRPDFYIFITERTKLDSGIWRLRHTVLKNTKKPNPHIYVSFDVSENSISISSWECLNEAFSTFVDKTGMTVNLKNFDLFVDPIVNIDYTTSFYKEYHYFDIIEKMLRNDLTEVY